VPEDAELIMRFHPVRGEDVSVLSKDFGGEEEALEQIAQLVDERRGLVLRRARYDREKAENGMVINLANVVSVRVSMKTAPRPANTCRATDSAGNATGCPGRCRLLRRRAATWQFVETRDPRSRVSFQRAQRRGGVGPHGLDFGAVENQVESELGPARVSEGHRSVQHPFSSEPDAGRSTLSGRSGRRLRIRTRDGR
jgi:hypothetical protein